MKRRGKDEEEEEKEKRKGFWLAHFLEPAN